jgi:hypothetical protein
MLMMMDEVFSYQGGVIMLDEQKANGRSSMLAITRHFSNVSALLAEHDAPTQPALSAQASIQRTEAAM